jgi:hypothetical protein
MAHGTLRAIRRDSENLAHGAQRFFKRNDSFRLNAVVVGDENEHCTYDGKEVQQGQAYEWFAGRLLSLCDGNSKGIGF